ncbi:barstar family protein [Hirschia litorea]|uniref:Ribonuclease inhibitor n=1 Tax=Hirschia litorea TaxID=1199156 RepID=A0ABW2INQ2_9PROT
MTKTFVLEGESITDISSFYDEINRVFMCDENWVIGESLDALNDLFYGGFGAISGRKNVKLVWRNIDVSRAHLGVEATRNYYLEKLNHPQRYKVEKIKSNLEKLRNENSGSTYFDLIIELINGHSNIHLVPD